MGTTIGEPGNISNRLIQVSAKAQNRKSEAMDQLRETRHSDGMGKKNKSVPIAGEP